MLVTTFRATVIIQVAICREYDPKVPWYFETEPVPEMNNRRIPS